MASVIRILSEALTSHSSLHILYVAHERRSHIMMRSMIALLGLAVMVLVDLASPNGTTADDTLSLPLYWSQPVHSTSKKSKTVLVTVTAYSSTPDQTDSTPFVTASGKRVRHGIVATNLLPFGTKVQIPKLFGDQVFVVEDRMHQRKTRHVDIWMSNRSKALRFGVKKTHIVVLS